MPDMLCSLVRLPRMEALLAELKGQGITIRRANPWEQSLVREFIETHFSRGWADEASIAFARQPVTCFVALLEEKIIGFAAYECTRRDYFGPTGVAEAYRGRGIGRALFLASLYGLQEMGYTYAVIGDAGPVEFYQRAVGAIVIPFDQGRGIYGLKEEPRWMSGDSRPGEEV